MGVDPVISPGTRLSPLWPSPPNSVRPLIITSRHPTSVCMPGFCYGQGNGGGPAQVSVRLMVSSVIHWGLGAQMLGGGGVSSAFSSWYLISTRYCRPICGSHSGKDIRPQRYWLWHRVHHRRICNRRAKWSE